MQQQCHQTTVQKVGINGGYQLLVIWCEVQKQWCHYASICLAPMSCVPCCHGETSKPASFNTHVSVPCCDCLAWMKDATWNLCWDQNAYPFAHQGWITARATYWPRRGQCSKNTTIWLKDYSYNMPRHCSQMLDWPLSWPVDIHRKQASK